MANFSVDLNPITVELEFGNPMGPRDQARVVVYLYEEPVKYGEWFADSHFWGDDLSDVRQRYTQLYEQFQAENFMRYLDAQTAGEPEETL